MKKEYLLKDDDLIVMPYWEYPIMKQAAKTICKNGGRVLNVGFGLGIVDTYIQEEGVDEHWIIENSPTILQKMKDEGWYDKENVVVVEGDWREVYPIEGVKFDGIYYDTFASGGQVYLIENLHHNLKMGGWFSFWSSLRPDKKKVYEETLTALGYETYYDDVYLPEGSEEEHYHVFGRDLNRKYTAISAQRVHNNKKSLL